MCVWLSGSTVETPNGWPHGNNSNSRGLITRIVGSIYRDIGRSYTTTHKHAKDEYHILASNADAGHDLWQFRHGNRLKLPRWYDVAKDFALIQPPSAFMKRVFLFCALVWTRGRSLASVTALQHPLFSRTYCTTGDGEIALRRAGCGGAG